MEDTLKLILNKLETMESSINELKDGQKKLESKVDNLEGKIDILTKKEEEHFDLLLSEQDKIYSSLDKRLSLLET